MPFQCTLVVPQYSLIPILNSQLKDGETETQKFLPFSFSVLPLPELFLQLKRSLSPTPCYPLSQHSQASGRLHLAPSSTCHSPSLLDVPSFLGFPPSARTWVPSSCLSLSPLLASHPEAHLPPARSRPHLASPLSALLTPLVTSVSLEAFRFHLKS